MRIFFKIPLMERVFHPFVAYFYINKNKHPWCVCEGSPELAI